LGHGLGYGGYLWPAAFTMCAQLDAEAETLANKRCLELGAGCGLVGLVAAQLGASVRLTDLAHVADHLRSNVLANKHLSHRVDVQALEFGSDIQATIGRGKFDLVFAADVTYTDEMQQALLVTLLQLVCDRTVLLLAHTDRDAAVTESLRRRLQQYFNVQEAKATAQGVPSWDLYRQNADVLLANFGHNDYTRHELRPVSVFRATLRNDLDVPVDELARFEVAKWAGVLQYPLHTGGLLVKVLCKPGVLVWEADLILAAYMETLPVRRLRGSWILELDVTSGLPSLVAASLGARVRLVANSENLLLHVEHNVGLNEGTIASACGSVMVRVPSMQAPLLSEGRQGKNMQPNRSFDLVVASTGSYCGEFRSTVLEDVARFVAQGSAVLIAQPEPFVAKSLQLLEELLKSNVVPVAPAVLPVLVHEVVASSSSVVQARPELLTVLESSRTNQIYGEGFTGKVAVVQLRQEQGK